MKLLGNLLDVYNMGKHEYFPYFSEIVLYAGDLMTLDRQGIKKHYFVEGERFLTNCGSEGHPSVYPLESIKGIEPEDPIDMSKNFENNIISYFTDHKYSNCRDTNIRKSQIDKHLMYRYKEFADMLRDNQKPEFYYLHTDRLGSGSAVTDGRGEAVHVLGYMPYGETLLDLSQGYETPYQFTGYEKDQETGFHYAGARYYDSRLSIFNSTDPMWYKYPHLSPYAYCSDNPVKYIDPDGMKIVGTDGKPVTFSPDKGWSSNAPKDVIKVGNAMMRTEIGTKVLNDMLRAKHDIYIKIQKQGRNVNEPQRLGFAQQTYVSDTYSDGSKKTYLKSVEITFYEEVMRETARIYNDISGRENEILTQDPTIQFSDIDRDYIELCPTIEDMYTTVGTHEGVHATSPKASRKFVGKEAAEKVARKFEKEVVQELIDNK